MKATGIVRRIDELGRVVIPKEIRRTLRIREGDPLEIFTDRDGEVILKKYSPIGELGDFAKEYAESLYQALGHTAVICDKDAVIAVAGGSKRELMDKPISEEVERLMKTRERGTFSRAQGNMIPLFSGDNGVYQSGVVVPILAGIVVNRYANIDGYMKLALFIGLYVLIYAVSVYSFAMNSTEKKQVQHIIKIILSNKGESNTYDKS